MATAQIVSDQFPVTFEMIREFLIREYELDKTAASHDYSDARIEIVMCGDNKTYETWRRGAKRQTYGI